MAFVHDHKEVVGEIVEKRVWRLPRFTTVDMGRVVLDAVAESKFRHHLEVVLRAHTQTLRFKQFVFAFELCQLLLQLGFNACHSRAHALIACGVMRGREHNEFFEFGDLFASERVDNDDSFNVVTEKFDANCSFVVCRMNFDGVATDTKLSANEVHVVAFVLHVDKTTQDGSLFVGLALTNHQHLVGVFLGITEAVNTRHRRNHDRVSASQQRRSRSVTQPLDLVIYRRVLLDVGIGGRHVGLGLVVVVIRDEVLDSILGEELPELIGQLRGQRFIRRHHQCGPLQLLDRPRNGCALTRTSNAEQRLEPISRFDTRRQFLNRLGLIAGRLKIRNESKRRHRRSLRRAEAIAPGTSVVAV